MKISHFFIDRPIFAGVIAVLITLIGGFAYFGLPVAQYPEIVPPTIVVNAVYPGATAETLADTVAAPIEQQINGVDNMLYMSSSSTADGNVGITVTFKLGTNLDTAQVLVQNRVATALPRLPTQVQALGVTTRKNSPDFLMVVHLLSPDHSLDQQYISNYATLQLRDRLARLEGAGDVRIFGARDYGMRIWIDPERAAAANLTAGDIVAALRGQNVQVAAGAIGQPPFTKGAAAYELNIVTLGRLTEPRQFEDVIIKATGGRIVRVRDVARVELGAQDYRVNSYLDGQPAVAIPIFQRPGSNALQAAKDVFATMNEAKKSFPPGLDYKVVYNPTEYVASSISEVEKTLFIAIGLVVVVVIVFLQSWRAAIIPVIAIPVSLIGTMAVLAAIGYSLNTLSLFGLVLAIGIVVDDAIVVVENVERNLEAGMDPHSAAFKSMDEVGGALIAIALVLCAVFVPTAFISGISGQFYKQFAVTIATATIFSLIVSLTLSPALAALLLRPKAKEGSRGPVGKASDWFNRNFDRLGKWYGARTKKLVRIPLIVGLVYIGLILIAAWRFAATPVGFIPAQDQGYLISAINLPAGASLARTDKVARQISADILKRKGIAHTVTFVGFNGATFSNAPNAATIFVTEASFDDRKKDKLTGETITNALRGDVAKNPDAQTLVIPPPPVRGIGTGGGFKMLIEDRAGRGYIALEGVTQSVVGQANGGKSIGPSFSLFNTKTPRLYADIDRQKAFYLGIDPALVFDTLQVYMGGTFVNDFNLLGRTFQVTAQADDPFRQTQADIANLKTRTSSGAMVPIGSVINFRNETGPYRVVRYNLYPASEVQGDTKPGFSSGQALAEMEKIGAKLPTGFGYDWTELAFQQRQAGNTAVLVFGAAVVFVFLLLAAQYESLTLPLAVILIVPMCLLAAIIGVDIRGFDNNILTQIGLVVLVGLAAKNAILIVEFARQAEDEGQDKWQAAQTAAQERLRPILMTSFAFIFGTIPLAIAYGAGAEMRQALGTAVVFGMLGVTIFGLMFTPVFYVITRSLQDWATGKGKSGGRKPGGKDGGKDGEPAPQDDPHATSFAPAPLPAR